MPTKLEVRPLAKGAPRQLGNMSGYDTARNYFKRSEQRSHLDSLAKLSAFHTTIQAGTSGWLNGASGQRLSGRGCPE